MARLQRVRREGFIAIDRHAIATDAGTPSASQSRYERVTREIVHRLLLVAIDGEVVAAPGNSLIAPLRQQNVGLSQASVEDASRLLPRLDLLRQTCQLHHQERRLQLRQAIVGSKRVVQVTRPVCSAANAVQQPRSLRQLVVVGQDDAPLTRG